MPDDFFNVTGAAHNYTRGSGSAPTSVRKKKSQPKPSPPNNKFSLSKTTTSLPMSPLQLDLENFDDPRYEGSRYVLTSPRSLDACAKLGFKPVDLLYKNLQDYEEEYPEWSVREIFELYEREEEQRRNNLKQARLMRHRLIEEEKLKQEEAAISKPKPSSKTSMPPTPNSRRSGTPTRKSSKQGPSHSILKRSSSAASVGHSASPSVYRSVSFENLRSPSSSTTSSARRHKDKEELAARVQRLSNPEDRRRLQLMIANTEAEIAQHEARRERGVQREEEAARDRLSQDIKENAYRRQIANSDHDWRRRQNELRFELEEAEEKERVKLSKSIQEKEAAHQRLLDNQRRQQERQLWEKKREEEKRRERVSNNLAEAESQLSEYQESVRSHSDELIQQTALRKLQKDMSAQKRKQLENIMRQEAFRYRKFMMEKRKELEIEDTRRNLNIRDSVVDMNQKKRQRESELVKQSTIRERQQKMSAALERKKKFDAEREEYQQQLKAYKDQSMENANNRLNEKMSETAGKLQAQLSVKNEQHRQKLEEIKRVEAEWQAETANLLNQRERRVRELEKEKEQRAQETREAAYSAERLREEIRKAYQMDSFDRKSHQVDLVNKMGLGGSAQLA